MNFDQDYISAVTKEKEPKRHEFYYESVDHARTMGVHVEGREPTELLKIYRPNEPAESRKYRLENWKPVTTSLSNKIINTVNRIFNPKLFRIEYPDNLLPEAIPEDESLDSYYNENYGIYQNIWVFIRETLLKVTFSDPNAVCFIFPENWHNIVPDLFGLDRAAAETEFLRPIPIIYRSEEVVDFVEDHYYTFWKPPIEKRVNQKGQKGKLIIVDQEMVRMWIVDKRSELKNLSPIEIPHNFGEPPAFRLGSQVEGKHDPYWFNSFIAGVAPHWDKVVNMTSDLDASTVNHLFPEAYEWQVDCPTSDRDWETNMDHVCPLLVSQV